MRNPAGRYLPVALIDDDPQKRNLRIRAASRNRSMEEEARQILRAALLDEPQAAADLATRIRSRFAGIGDVQLPQVEREPVRLPPSLDAGTGRKRKDKG